MIFSWELLALYCLFGDGIEALIRNETFKGELKLGDRAPVFKSLQNTIKKNYRPITVLVAVSKIFEKIMDKQTNSSYLNILVVSEKSTIVKLLWYQW